MTSDATETVSGLHGPSSATFSCQRPLPNHEVEQLEEVIWRDAPPEGWRRPQAMQTMLCTLCTSSWWSSSWSWHFLQGYTCPQHGASTWHLHAHAIPPYV